jgi:hypothetical protein
MTEVRTRDEAIASVDRALQAWSTNVTGILTLAHNGALDAKNEVEGVVRKRANEVAAIETFLAAADDEQRRQLQAKLVRAKEAHEQAGRACIRVSDVAARVAQLSRTHTTLATSQVASARAQLSAMSMALEGYRSGGADLGGGLSSGRSTTRASGGPLASMGLADFDVSAAYLDENPILDDDRPRPIFGKGGLSRADYRWAVQTWNDTVGPGVASGKTREDFAERDARSNAQPLRRTADVYDMFLGTDRIRADRQPDGSLNIVNGRHRLLIARELGIKNLPGQVS